MKKLLIFLLFGLPLILFALLSTRVQNSNLDFIDKAASSFEQKNYSFFLNPENVKEAEQLLAQNIQDLTPLLSNYNR